MCENCKAVLFFEDTALLALFTVGGLSFSICLQSRTTLCPPKTSLIQRGSEAKLQSCSDAADVWVHCSTAFPMLWPRSANKENTCVSSLSVRIKRLSTVCALPNVSLTTCLSLSNREMPCLHCRAHRILFFPFFWNKVSYHLGCLWVYYVADCDLELLTLHLHLPSVELQLCTTTAKKCPYVCKGLWWTVNTQRQSSS